MTSFSAIILSHEDFAHSLKNTLEKIAGPQKNMYTYSNKTDGLPVLMEKINHQIENLATERIYIFVDLIGGSCWSLANMIYKKHPDVVVIGGVNLPMLVSLIINYESLPAEKLTEKILQDSKKGIQALGIN